MRTFVVPDLHARAHLAQGLLERAGLVSETGERLRRDVRVVQLGDLANCIADSRGADVEILRAQAEWYDVLLVGNHELPYFGGPSFAGFESFPAVAEAIAALEWRPALAVGGTLLTHAGVHPDLCLPGTAAEAEAVLLEAWATLGGRHGFFARIGRCRGGIGEYGGVVWSDFLGERRDERFSQVHGHTVVEYGPVVLRAPDGRFVVALDCGGHGPDVRRIVGLWLDEDGELDADLPFVEFQGARP